MTVLIERIENHPFTSIGGTSMLVSFDVLKSEILTCYGLDDVVYDIDQVEIRLSRWSAFGTTAYDAPVRVDAIWENRNYNALLAAAIDVGLARAEANDEKWAAERRWLAAAKEERR